MVTEAVNVARHTLLTRLETARDEADALFRTVKTEAMYDRPIAERHRIVFYVGHLEAFDRNLLSDPASARSEFDELFAFGIDPVGGNLPTDQPADWPSLGVVYDYRDRTRAHVDGLIERMAARGDEEFDVRLNVAIEHRLMHAETLAYIFHQLPYDRKHGAETYGAPSHHPTSSTPLRIPAGHAMLGLRRESGMFGWDNEFEAHTAAVPEFSIARSKVTNGEFLRFVNDGGYQERSLWSPEDWEWRSSAQFTHPLFWEERNGAWMYRAMFSEIPLPPHEPVYVSHAEASAYARWQGKALPSEEQWHRAASGSTEVEDLHGTGWEWTSTKFAPFPGFTAMPFYPGYSEPFFDGKHYVMKGGSPRTAPVMLRPSFRNWFQPHYPYVYAGFRCVEKENA
ncbi:MAG TPA: SUMF1/EgtB/PvdO family nonheme iron enzyme [Bryobacteraceae bacterium]|jgi:ergothioneine biosynthesis protein EgtB